MNVQQPDPIAGQNAGKGSLYQTITLKQLMNGPTEIDWILEPFVPPSTVLILYGDAGVGKTWLLCDLALALASGGKWLGHFQAKQQTVLVVDEENSELLLRVRLEKMLKARRLATDLPLHFVVGQAVNLTPESLASQATITSIGAARLLRTIEYTGAQVVICDSLTRIHRANENASHEMAAVSGNIHQIARETGASFVLAHHVNKGGGMRGSTDIRNFCDTAVSVTKKGGTLYLAPNKWRWTERMERFQVKLILSRDGSTVRLLHQDASVEASTEAESDETWEWIQNQLAPGIKKREVILKAADEAGLSVTHVDQMLRDRAEAGDLVTGKVEGDKRRITYRLAEGNAPSPANKD